MFAENLHWYMEKYGMTNTQLAKRLGVSEVAVSRWLSGQRNPRTEMIGKMCEVFKCQPNDLLIGHDDKDAYTKALRLLSSLNTDELQEVIKFVGKLTGDHFN